MRISTVHSVLEYEVKDPSHFCLHVQAAHCDSQTILSERLAVSPEVPLRNLVDERTGSRFIRFDAPVGKLKVDYQADVALHARAVEDSLPEVPVSELPGDIFPFLLPSRYCEADALCAPAQQLFCKEEPGLARVRAISKWIHENVKYVAGSTGVTTSAKDIFVQRTGVCRDFAHLGIALCRAMNIPARMVAGYVWFEEEPQDFHATFEAWLGGRWVLFDPTGMAPPERLVRIGCGFDAVDVAFATYFGDVRFVSKDVTVVEHEEREPLGEEERVEAGAALQAA